MAKKEKQFPWLFSTFWLVILVVMISAGFWQLDRADEKKRINNRMASGEINQPRNYDDWLGYNAFDQIKMRGQYLDTHFLLDNQIMESQVGFFVFTAFRTVDGELLLVNRGWSDDDQQNFTVIKETTDVTGRVSDWPRPGVKLGEQQVKKQVIQHLTYLEQQPVIKLLKERHCQQIHADNCIIVPRVLKLDGAMKNGFKRQWQLPRMTVEKHRAYAFQWFSMSLVLCLVYVVFLRKYYL